MAAAITQQAPERPPAGRPSARRGDGRRRSRLRTDRRPYALMVLPAVLLVAALMVYPVINGVQLSFHRAATYDAGGSPWVGLRNYRRFFDYPQHNALIWHSYLRAIGGVVPSFLLGLGAALVLDRRRRFGRPLQVVTLVPFVISAPVSIFMWQVLISPQFGIGRAVGLQWPNLLVDIHWVWPTLLLINAWASFPFYTIVLLAALQRVPDELYEAASVDGAARWRQFWHVTMPGIRTVAAAACAFHFMASFQDISLVYIATGGGPLNLTQTMSTYAYQSAFGSGFSIGYAAAVAMISLVLMLATVVAVLAAGTAVVRLGGRIALARRRRARRAVLAAPAAVRPPSPARRSRLARPGRRRPRDRSTVGSTVLAGLLGLFALVPILFVLVQSIDGSPPGSDAARLWPRQPTLHNFVAVFGNRDFYHSTSTTRPALALNFFNSLVVSVTVTVIVLVTGSLAGYALARWRGWTPNITTSLLIVVQFVPQVILVFPLYGILARAHLLNSRTGLILATAAVSLPVAVLFFRVFFQGMSKDLEEAAKLDGAGSLRIFARIVAPNARPAFGAMGAFTLIGTWNEFVLALTLIQDPSRRTFPPALQQFTQLAFNYADAKNTPGVQAVYLLIPIATSVLLLSFTVRHFTAAVQGGGVKG